MNDAIGSCRKIIQEHSKSFSLAARLLPARCRDDAVALYAWCRRADDAIDHCQDADAHVAIHRLRKELASVYRGETQTDFVLAAFQSVTQGRQIPLVYPTELLDGMQMDAEGREYETMDDLIGYCHRAAGVVGLMMCHVLGVRDDRALPHAAHLGIAMQLTNICRDVDEDARRGRCYLPVELLPGRARVELLKMRGRGGETARGEGRHGCSVVLPLSCSPDLPLPLEARLALKSPLRQLLALADKYYQSADRGMRYLDGRTAVAIRTARLVYWGIGRDLARRDYDVGAGRAHVSTLEKARLTARALLASLLALARRSPLRTNARVPGTVLQCDQAVGLDPSTA